MHTVSRQYSHGNMKFTFVISISNCNELLIVIAIHIFDTASTKMTATFLSIGWLEKYKKITETITRYDVDLKRERMVWLPISKTCMKIVQN